MLTLGELQKLQSFIPVEEVSGTPERHGTLGVHLKGIGLCLLSTSLPYKQQSSSPRVSTQGKGKEVKNTRIYFLHL